jgi:hypothetical protein
MTLVEPPLVQPADDLDGLLRAFYQSEMPHPWPSPPRPASRATDRRASRGPSLFRSRLALAASVALLLLGCLLLPGRLGPATKPEDDLGAMKSTADTLLQKKMRQSGDQVPPDRIRPGFAAQEEDPDMVEAPPGK